MRSINYNEKCYTAKAKTTSKSLVTIKMNEIFMCLACNSQKLNFFCLKIETKINPSYVKGSIKQEIVTTFLKIKIYDLF